MKINLKWKLALSLAIKMVLGFLVGYLLAELFTLKSSFTAGVITVLSMAFTREEVLKNALKRGVSSLIGLAFAYLIFLIPMPRIYAIIIIVVILLPALVFMKLEIGAVIALTLISHLYLAEAANLTKTLLNSIYILIIGIGVALVLNLYNINVKKDVDAAKISVDDCFHHLATDVTNNVIPNFANVRKVHDQATKILEVAKRNGEVNYVKKHEEYLRIRRLHLRIIEKIIETNSNLSKSHHQEVVMAFVNDVLAATGNEEKIKLMGNKLTETYVYFENLPLPITRKEFEERAELFHILKELEAFINLEVNWYNKYALLEVKV